MCVTPKLVTLCHYIVLTHTVFCDAMGTNSLSRPTGYQSAAISESMHQYSYIYIYIYTHTHIHTYTHTHTHIYIYIYIYIYKTQLFGKLCSTQLHTSQCKGYVPLTLLNFTGSFLTEITFSVMMSIITTFSTACHIPTSTKIVHVQ